MPIQHKHRALLGCKDYDKCLETFEELEAQEADLSGFR